MGQKQVRKQPKSQEKTSETETVEVQKNPEIEEHKQTVDELLDEIDEILEENAEAFVRGYVQAGGE